MQENSFVSQFFNSHLLRSSFLPPILYTPVSGLSLGSTCLLKFHQHMRLFKKKRKSSVRRITHWCTSNRSNSFPGKSSTRTIHSSCILLLSNFRRGDSSCSSISPDITRSLMSELLKFEKQKAASPKQVSSGFVFLNKGLPSQERMSSGMQGWVRQDLGPAG